MLTVNHVISGSLLVVLIAFSPMSINAYYGGTAVVVSSISGEAN